VKTCERFLSHDRKGVVTDELALELAFRKFVVVYRADGQFTVHRTVGWSPRRQAEACATRVFIASARRRSSHTDRANSLRLASRRIFPGI